MPPRQGHRSRLTATPPTIVSQPCQPPALAWYPRAVRRSSSLSFCCYLSVSNPYDRDLENFGLAPFEVAQLGNLCPQDAQEAKALVPSLAMPDREIDNSQLTELLEQLNSHTQQYGQ